MTEATDASANAKRESALADIQHLKDSRPYFDARHVPTAPHRFVCWLDVMGASSAMQRSHVRAANYVMKLHSSVLVDASQLSVALYPVIDGVYMISDDASAIRDAIVAVMCRLGVNFLFEQNEFRFLVRGAVAFGPVVLSAELEGNSHVLREHTEYCNRVAIGMPLTQAYVSERNAPPYGIHVHESARAFSPLGASWLRTVNFRWWRLDDDGNEDHVRIAAHLKREVDAYLVWCQDHSEELIYEPDRIRAHRELARQYFAHDGRRPKRATT